MKISQRTLVTLFLLAAWLVTSTGYAASGVAGRVIGPAGNALSGASVTLTGVHPNWQQKKLTDLNGEFHFTGIAGRVFFLSCELAGYEVFADEYDLTGRSEVELEITLNPSRQLIIQERVMVIGDPSQVGEIPGSAHYLGKEELAALKLDFDDVHQYLARVPGLNVQDEEGYGLRPNIGIRGSGSERSSKITLMEDGILIAPAPYAAPSAYYFPTAGRMEAIEVRKGSSQVKHGPRTTGGVLNLVSSSIPSGFAFTGNLSAGEESSLKRHFSVGDSSTHFGWLLESYQFDTDGFKQLDGGGDTGFGLDDYLAKFRVNTASDAGTYQELEFKLGYTTQTADETYLGLTDADFRENPFRRYRGSQADRFDSRHRQYQARHFIAPSASLDITTIFYRNDFHRNWYKLQSVGGVGINRVLDAPDEFAQELAVIRGAESAPDELAVRANNRDYYSTGVQSTVGWRLPAGPFKNHLQFGWRYHRDQEDRFQHEDGFQMNDGRMVLSSRGAPGSQSNRIGDAKAWAFFVQDKLDWGRWSLTPGVRYERVELVRTDYSRDDPQRQTPTRVRTNQLDVFIPGLGISYRVNGRLNLFGGVHKGFAPPGPGSSQDTRSEASVNYESGLRWQSRMVQLQAATFVNDYSNLLGADSLASGGTGEGSLFNGGRSRVRGLELSARAPLDELFDWSFELPVELTYSLTDGQFLNSFESDFEPWGNVVTGDSIPYLPRHQFFAAVTWSKFGWRIQTQAHYQSRMRTVAGQGPLEDLASTDSRLLWNLSGEYDLRGLSTERLRASLFLSIRNLTNQEYIVARRPAGARPGLPRTLIGGLRFRFGR